MDRSAWDKAYARYQAVWAINKASQEFGPYKEAENDHALERMKLGWDDGMTRPVFDRLYPQRSAEVDALGKRMQRIEDEQCGKLYQPLWDACHAVAACSAPDVEALVRKIEVITEHEVWNDASFGFDCWELILADAERLTGLKLEAPDFGEIAVSLARAA